VCRWMTGGGAGDTSRLWGGPEGECCDIESPEHKAKNQGLTKRCRLFYADQ
jgi:hypothetical protein